MLSIRSADFILRINFFNIKVKRNLAGIPPQSPTVWTKISEFSSSVNGMHSERLDLRGRSRISGKWIHMYKGVGGSPC